MMQADKDNTVGVDKPHIYLISAYSKLVVLACYMLNINLE